MLPQGLLGLSPFLLVIPFVAWVGFWVSLKGARRAGLPERRVLFLQMALALSALAGAKAFSLLFEWGWNPLDPGNREAAGGWRYPGGLFALLLAVAVLKPRVLPEVSLARYADLLAPAAAAAVGTFRIHCILQGCCVGDVCQSFFCVSYAPHSEVWQHQLDAQLIATSAWSIRVLPLHVLFMGASLSVAALLWRFDPRRRYDGQVFLLYLVLHEGTKFGLELLREPSSLLLQLSSLAPALVGLLLVGMVEVGRRSREPAAG